MTRPIQKLLAILVTGDDLQSEQAAHELSAYGDEAADALANLLTSGEADARWWSARTLAMIPGEKSAAVLVKGLEDEDGAVRQCAALALREQPHALATEPLCAQLNNNNRLLARLAGDALVAIGGPAVDRLLKIAVEGERREQLEAVRALAMIGDTKAVSTLFKLLDEDSALLEYWASEGLDKMGIGMAFFKV